MLVIISILLVCVAPFYVVYKPPFVLMRYFQYRWPDVLFYAPASSKIVALTIDDAPSGYTHDILRLLEATDAQATFFVIGSHIDGRETILEDILKKGHELGNHAMHDEPSKFLSDARLMEEIRIVESKLQSAYTAAEVEGPPKYFRPGSGFFSERMRKVLDKLGYRLVLGSIYPHDPQIPYWRLNAAHILSMVRPGGIIICHDGRSWTIPMLEKILPELKRRGYRVVTVSGLLKATAS